MTSAQTIAICAAALALNPNDSAARSEMARALARAGTPTNTNDTATPEEKSAAGSALWNLTNEDANERPREEYHATCSAYVATHSPDEIAQTLNHLCGAVRNAKAADLRRYFQRYAEQTIANEPADDERHQDEASNQARDFCDPTDPDEVRAAIDAIETANSTASWLFDLDEYEANFGEIGPPKKKGRSYFNDHQGNDLPQTFRDMLRAVTECLDMEAISKRNAPDRSELARYLWDRIDSELESSAEDEGDRATWLAAIVAAWPDLEDAEGAAAVIWDAVDRSNAPEDEDPDFDPNNQESETPDQDGAW